MNSSGLVPAGANALLDSTIDLLQRKVGAKQAKIEREWNAEVEILAITGELRQVFSNLLANSLDAIGTKGTIRIRVSTCSQFGKTHSPYVRVTVADNGKGISRGSQAHIFEPFFTTKGSVGTGLGLWVAEQIVEKHGGSIRMRSSVERAKHGAVFSITLPIQTVPHKS